MSRRNTHVCANAGRVKWNKDEGDTNSNKSSDESIGFRTIACEVVDIAAPGDNDIWDDDAGTLISEATVATSEDIVARKKRHILIQGQITHC